MLVKQANAKEDPLSSELKIIFAGTPDFAARHLAALVGQHNIVAVYTQPDRPAGRGKKPKPSEVKQLALQHALPVYQPATLRDAQAQQVLASHGADLMIVVAYGLILPTVVLNTPRLGCINVHGSLLPKWRGAAPIQRSLEAGDAETGVTIMQMDEGLDTGPMLLKSVCPITASDTSASLYEKLAELGPIALQQVVSQLAAGTAQAHAQDDSLATHAAKLSKQESEIDWTQPAEIIERRLRAFTPWPGCTTHVQGHTLKVHQTQLGQAAVNATAGTIIRADKQGIEVATGSGSLILTQLQLPGKKAIDAATMLNARAEMFAVGSILGAVAS